MRLLLTVFFLTAEAALAQTPTPISDIVVRAVSEIQPSTQKEVLTLADLVERDAQSEKLTAERFLEVKKILARIEVSDRPPVGEERVLSEEAVDELVQEANRRLQAAGMSEMRWRMPKWCRALVRWSLPAIQDRLRTEFSQYCFQRESCEVHLSQINVQPGQLDFYDLALQPLARKPQGSFSMSATALNSHKQPLTVRIAGMAKFTEMVPVLTKSISANEHIGIDAIKWERRDVTFSNDRPALASDLGHSVSSKGLNVGEVLFKNVLKQEVAVRFGDPVHVQVNTTDLSVATDGIAQGQGSIGDAVKVKVKTSGKLVSGQIKEKNLVEITE